MLEWIKKYWLETLFSMLISGLSAFGVWTRKRFKEQDLVKLGVQALLRNEIIKEYNYWTEKGYCPIYTRDNIKNMYDNYHNLGANGTITDLVERIFELPTKKPERGVSNE